MNEFGILKKIELTVVSAGGENVREHTVVVVPGQLERSTTIVLLTRLGRPGIVSPSTLLVITRWIIGAVAADFLDPVEGLCPEFSIVGISLTSLLAPVSKNCRQLSFTRRVE